MDFYKGLPVALYDDFFPEIDEQELDFYARHIAASAQPALEIGCGTGRLLLPLLERGFAVEGFDSSPEMLALCKSKASQKGLAPILYEQAMQELALPKQYGCIFSALGTFQQVADREQAQRALQKFYEHLVPGGRLVMYLHLPWYYAPAFGEWREQRVITQEGKQILVHEKSVHDAPEQLIFLTLIYEISGETETVQERAEQTIRWYSRYEFVMMLERAGFEDISVTSGYEDEGPFEIMMFCAKK